MLLVYCPNTTGLGSSYRRWWLRDPTQIWFGYRAALLFQSTLRSLSAATLSCSSHGRLMRYPYWPDGNESLAVT